MPEIQRMCPAHLPALPRSSPTMGRPGFPRPGPMALHAALSLLAFALITTPALAGNPTCAEQFPCMRGESRTCRPARPSLPILLPTPPAGFD